MVRTFLDIDMARAADLLGMEKRSAEMFRDLERGHFVALGPAVSRRPLPIRIGEVQTSTRSNSHKFMPTPATSGDNLRDLIFAPASAEPRRAAPPPPRIGRAHVCTPVTKANTVCPFLFAKQNIHTIIKH